MVTRRTGVVAALLLALCFVGPLTLVVADPAAANHAAAESNPRLSCQFASPVDGGARAVSFTVVDLPRGARVLLERRDGPKGTYQVVDVSTAADGVLEDAAPTSLRTLYRVEVVATRGRVVAQQALVANRGRPFE